VAAFIFHASRAALFALGATAVCLLFDPIWHWLISHEAVGFIPKALAVVLGGVHNPSFMGLFAGLFLEWFVVGLLGSVLLFTATKLTPS
jgi:hypothetical protein